MTTRKPAAKNTEELDRRLSELQFTAFITATCRRCGYQYAVDVAAVAPKVGWNLPARALTSELRCLRCAALECDISVRSTAPPRGST